MPDVAQVPVEIQGILVGKGYVSLKFSRNFCPWVCKQSDKTEATQHACTI